MSIQEHHKDQFDNSTDEELEKVIREYKPDTAAHRYCLALLNRRVAKAQASILSSIDRRLTAVEKFANTPEHKTWNFRLILITLIATLIGVVIAVLAWQNPVDESPSLDPLLPIHSEQSQPPIEGK